MKRLGKKSFFPRFIAYALAAVVSFGLYLGYEQLTGNFHEVIKGELYRSGQLSESRIAKYAKEYRIASIVNLRGENAKEEWYINEMKASKLHGIKHFDYAISSKRELTDLQAFEIIRLIKSAPKPVLVHCNGGADRSGLAVALYLAAEHPSLDAESQLSAQYGYFRYRHIGAPAMQKTYDRLKYSIADGKLEEPLYRSAQNFVKIFHEE